MTITACKQAVDGIRLATVEDIPRIVEMGQNFMANTSYKEKMTENPAQMELLARQVIANPQGIILVYELDGVLVGMIGLMTFIHPMSGELTATELIWWVEPDQRSVGVRLLKSAQAWAEGSGAKVLQMVAPTDHVAKFYERMGYEKVEVNYQLRLKGSK